MKGQNWKPRGHRVDNLAAVLKPVKFLTIGHMNALASSPCELIHQPAVNGSKASDARVNSRLDMLNLQDTAPLLINGA